MTIIHFDTHRYIYTRHSSPECEEIQQQQLAELAAIQHYAQQQHCYIAYLGEDTAHRCGVYHRCDATQFPSIQPTQRIQTGVGFFLCEEFILSIQLRTTEKGIAHEADWSLSTWSGSASCGTGTFALYYFQFIESRKYTSNPERQYD